MQSKDSIEKYAYETNKELICENEEIKYNNKREQYKK